MTGFRAARIQAGYRTAAEAHAAFAKGKKGREALSLSYWQKLEARGGSLMNPTLVERLARFLGCSANLVFAWSAEAAPSQKTTNEGSSLRPQKGEVSPVASRQPRHGSGKSRPLTKTPLTKTKGPEGNPNPSEPQKATTTNMQILSHGGSR